MTEGGVERVAISEEGMMDWRAVVVVPPIEVLIVISFQVPTRVELVGESMEEQEMVPEDVAEA